MIPGLTAAQGAAASLGIPLTHRSHARALVFATGHLQSSGQSVDLECLIINKQNQTVVIYMGLATLPIISRELIAHGLPSSTPAALIERATTPEQRCVTGTLSSLPAMASAYDLRSPTLIVIGEVVKLHAVLHQSTPEVMHV